MSFKSKRYPFYVGITTLVVAVVVVLTGLFPVDQLPREHGGGDSHGRPPVCGDQ